MQFTPPKEKTNNQQQNQNLAHTTDAWSLTVIAGDIYLNINIL